MRGARPKGVRSLATGELARQSDRLVAMTADDDKTKVTGPGLTNDSDQDVTRLESPLQTGRASRSTDDDGVLQAGTILSHTYRIGGLLGRGGMGEIYSASHVELGTQHAIKVIRQDLADDPKIIALFRREAGVLRNLRDDAVVAYDGVFRDETGRLFLVMEFVDGPSLAELLDAGPLSASDIDTLRNRIASGLAVAHDNAVIHRDISPDNIIIPERQIENAKIIDFGVAKLADVTEKTILGDEFAGKYSYVSPEQLGMFGGHIDGRSDIFSLGLVLAASCLGRPLDMGRSPAAAVEARKSVPDLSSLPKELAEDLAKMLQPDPNRRPGSIRDIIAESTEVRRSGVKTAVMIRFAVGVGLIVIAAGGYWAYSNYIIHDPVIVEHKAEPKASTDQPGPDENQAEQPPPQPEDAQPPQLPEPSPTPPPTVIPSHSAVIESLDDTLTRFLGSINCGTVGGTLAESDFIATLFGHLSNRSQLDQLLSTVRATEGVLFVDTNKVKIISSTNCKFIQRIEQIDIKRSSENIAETALFGSRLQAIQLSFQDGDFLDLILQSPDFPSFMYVDYFDNNGQVQHLSHSSAFITDLFAPGKEIPLSDDRWRISEPFGHDLLVAFFTSAPLFVDSRPLEEDASGYQEKLLKSLSALRLSEPDFQAKATYIIVETGPKP